MVGENIFKEFGFPKNTLAKTVMEGWMNSPEHRANILQKEFTHIGVGVVVLEDTFYFTQVFAGREINSFNITIEESLGKYFFRMLLYTDKSDEIAIIVNGKMHTTLKPNKAGSIQVEIPFTKNSGIYKIQWGPKKNNKYWISNEVIIDTDKPIQEVFVGTK